MSHRKLSEWSIDGPTTLSGSDDDARTIRLDCYGITIRLAREHTDDRPGSGTITSDLRDRCDGREDFCSAIDGLESLILAHACAGVDVEAPPYVEGIETAVEAIFNNL